MNHNNQVSNDEQPKVVYSACLNCGTINSSIDKFCSNCKKTILSQSKDDNFVKEELSIQSSEDNKQPKRKYGCLSAIGIFFIVCIVAYFVIYYLLFYLVGDKECYSNGTCDGESFVMFLGTIMLSLIVSAITTFIIMLVLNADKQNKQNDMALNNNYEKTNSSQEKYGCLSAIGVFFVAMLGTLILISITGSWDFAFIIMTTIPLLVTISVMSVLKEDKNKQSATSQNTITNNEEEEKQ